MLHRQKSMDDLDLQDMWKECFHWLHSLDLVKASHPLLRSGATVNDFASFLMDGVILCNLLHRMSPKTININKVCVNTKKKQPLCIRNAEIFLESCKNIFGIKEQELFEPQDIFNGENFGTVIKVISLLSQSSIAQNQGILPFYIDETGYYNNIADLIKRSNSTVDDSEVDDIYECISEDIYNSLVQLRRKDSLISLTVPKTQKEYILNELFTTERKYIEAMETLKTKFIVPLENYLSSDYHNIIFCKITEFHKIHTDLLNAMQESQESEVSTCFVNFKERFLQYGDYCCNLPRAQALIDALNDSDSRFKEELAKCEQNAWSSRYKLRDTIAMPLQRILKYKLLLEDLLKNVSNNSEHQKVELACNEMKDLNEYMNEVKRDHDIIEIIKNYQNRISQLPVNDLKEFGRLIIHESMRVKLISENTLKERYVYLFDKILLICKHNKSSDQTFEYIIYLEKAFCERLHKDRLNYFSVKGNVYGQKMDTFVFQAKSIESREHWIKKISDAINNLELIETKSFSFRMASFKDRKNCYVCGKLLKGLLFQGYLCSKSGIAVHKECISKSEEKSLNESLRMTSREPELTPKQKLLKQIVVSSAQEAPERPKYLKMMSKPSYVNDFELDRALWFAGLMSREVANLHLNEMPDGTYMVRQREGTKNVKDYALSIMYGYEVRHMLIENKDKHYFLSVKKLFISINHLITYYQLNSLEDMFPLVKTNLQIPYKIAQPIVIGKCRVLHTFNPDSEAELFISAGTIVDIVSKPVDGLGWWKGFSDKKIGYFPSNFVEEL